MLTSSPGGPITSEGPSTARRRGQGRILTGRQRHRARPLDPDVLIQGGRLVSGLRPKPTTRPGCRARCHEVVDRGGGIPVTGVFSLITEMSSCRVTDGRCRCPPLVVAVGVDRLPHRPLDVEEPGVLEEERPAKSRIGVEAVAGGDRRITADQDGRARDQGGRRIRPLEQRAGGGLRELRLPVHDLREICAAAGRQKTSKSVESASRAAALQGEPEPEDELRNAGGRHASF